MLLLKRLMASNEYKFSEMNKYKFVNKKMKDDAVFLWVREELFEFSLHPIFPAVKISRQKLKRTVEYCKKKINNPDLLLSWWNHIFKNKLGMGAEMGWFYFRYFHLFQDDNLTIEKDKSCEDIQINPEEKASLDTGLSVPFDGFILFLFIQHFNKLHKKLRHSSKGFSPRNTSEWSPTKEWTEAAEAAEEENNIKQPAEKIHYDFVHTCLEEIISLLTAGNENGDFDRIEMSVVKSLNIFIAAWVKPGDKDSKAPQDLEDFDKILMREQFWKEVHYDPDKQTLDRRKLVLWVRDHLIINPFGPYSTLEVSEKIKILTGLSSNQNSYVAQDNKIVSNLLDPPNGWCTFSICVSTVNEQTVLLNKIPMMVNLKIHRCTESFIYAPQLLSSATLNKCNNGKVFVGVVKKVLKVSACENTSIYAICRQLVISDCINCRFFIHTPNRPFLGGCKNENITLSPYNTNYPNLETHMQLASISNAISKWDSPFCIETEGGQMEENEEQRVWKKLSLDDFSVISFPFQMNGSIAKNSLPLPLEFKKNIELNGKMYRDWQRLMEHRLKTKEQREELEKIVCLRFKNWMMNLEKKDKMEIDGLKSFEYILNL